MNILDYIPQGRSKAISRDALERVTGLNDRVNKEMIEEARQPIEFIRRQESRRKAIQKGINTAYDWLGKVCHE